MSTVTAPPRLEPGPPPAPPEPPAGGSRLGALLPLLAIFAAAVLVYGFQAWQHKVPWLFQDEIFYASQAREYAATGEMTIRGEPSGDDPLTTRVTSIAWHFDDPETDYLAAKLLNVLLMAAACFPAYALARLVVSRGWALFAAAGTVAIPAFVYTSMILTEPFAYLLSTTALWLMVRGLAERRLGWRVPAWLLAALVASFLASEARSQLRVLFIVIAVAGALRLVLSEPIRRRRPLFLLGAALFAVEIFGIYRVVTRPGSYAHDYMYEWERVGQMATWGGGAFAIGLGVVPAVLGLAALWPVGERRRLPAHAAFSLVGTVAVLTFLWYTGVKGTFLSFTFAIRVIERNMIYAAPLLFVAVAIFLQYRRLNPLALAGALAAVTYAVYEVPYQLSFRIYSDAPGLAILSTANRHLQWTDGSVRKYLAVMLAVSAALALAPYLVRSRAVLRLGAVALGIVLAGLSLTAEVAADRSSRGTSSMFYDNLPKPLDWVHEATRGQRAVLIGVAIADPNGVWLTQFFNPNVYYLVTLDSLAPPPGPNSTGDVVDSDGRLGPQLPDAPFAVVDNKIRIVGKVIRRTTYQTLWRIEQPLRLADAKYGVMGDGWMGSSAKYFQFASPAGAPGPGAIRVVASRAAWGGEDVPGHVTISVSKVHWEGPHDSNEGKLVEEPPLEVQELTIHTRQIVEYLIPAPAPPFVVNLTVDPTFSPGDFGFGDTRQLGIMPEFEFLPGMELSRVRKRELNPPAIPE